MSEINDLNEVLGRIPPMSGKVVFKMLPEADMQSDAEMEAQVRAMLASWRNAIVELGRLRAENERLRKIEEASRSLLAGHAKLGLHSEAWTGFLNALAAKGEA